MHDRIVNYGRIEKAIGFLSDNFKAQPDLNEIARQIHLSPYHFQRLFVDWVGISPKKFLQYLTIGFLKNKIKETPNVIAAAEISGLSSQSRVYDLFVHIEGVTPDQYKKAGTGMKIYYGYHSSPFGMCFVAAADKGLCGFRFIDEDRKRLEFEEFEKQWRCATLIHKPDYTQPIVKKIFHPDRVRPDNLHVLVQGTKFQIKVWEALVRIPFGSVRTFQQIADTIQQPGSARAVGNAVGKNHLIYLIPCHRVICKDGTGGNYHWGKARKMAMIGWEMVMNER